jgi:hypothetical protein
MVHCCCGDCSVVGLFWFDPLPLPPGGAFGLLPFLPPPLDPDSWIDANTDASGDTVVVVAPDSSIEANTDANGDTVVPVLVMGLLGFATTAGGSGIFGGSHIKSL